jgi:hypothetical protein
MASVRQWHFLDSWSGRAGLLSVSCVVSFGLYDLLGHSNKPSTVLDLTTIPRAVEAVMRGRTVPEVSDVLPGSGSGEVAHEQPRRGQSQVVARLPCRHPTLAGKAEVVVRYHDTTPEAVVQRMREREEKMAQDMRAFEEAEKRADAEAASNIRSETQVAKPKLTPTNRRSQAGGWSWSSADTAIPGSTRSGASAGSGLSTSEAASSDTTKAVLSSASSPCEVSTSTLNIVAPPERPLVTVANRISAWERWGESWKHVKEALFTPDSASAGWLRVNTAQDKLRLTEFRNASDAWRSPAAAATAAAAPDGEAAAHGTEPKIALPQTHSRGGAIRYASVRIERTSPSATGGGSSSTALPPPVEGTVGLDLGSDVAASPLGLTKCQSYSTAAECVPDPDALPSVIGRLTAGAAALLPFPLPTHCKVALLGLDAPALPVFLDNTLFKNLAELHVVDSEPALLDGAVAFAGLAPSARHANPRRFQLHATSAEEFLVREENKMDLLVVNLTAGGEAAATMLQEAERPTKPSKHKLSHESWDPRYSASFAKLCWMSLSSVGVVAFAMDSRRTGDCEHLSNAVERTFGRENVFVMPSKDLAGAGVTVVLAAKQLPTNGLSGRHLAGRYKRLSQDLRWPFDASVHLPPSFFVW